MDNSLSNSSVFPVGSMILFQTRKTSKPRLGRITDLILTSGGIRYKVERRVSGMFLDNIADYIDGKSGYVKDVRWCFFMWMKPERIKKVLPKI